jgi:drug/metabolite transporter (DMT)-like permease
MQRKISERLSGSPGPATGWLDRLANEPRLLMLLPGLFWAGNAIVARSVAAEMSAVGLAFWRWTLAALIALPFAWPHLRRDVGAMVAHWPAMLLLSALGIAFFNTGLYTAAHETTALNIVMLQSALPVMVVAASFLLFRDRVTWNQGVGIVISLAGALVLIAHGDPGVLEHFQFNPGDLWMLAACVSYALYTALLRLRPVVHGLSFLFATFVIGALMLLPFYVRESAAGSPMPFSWHALLAVGYVALFASILAYLAFNRTVELLGANTAGLAVHLVPVFGTILAIGLLGEELHLYHALGIGLIGTGIALATRKPRPA